ncbi:hypothetical protein [Streptomyces sp. H27-C3]|uniref:hypothetical protein n=1 Tax=Streptomyces sp. H27-C3 TaxID=3046305 RepID=UPI0024BA73E2|nr:hypothetical protein [Streptomyces sp. H27-C3]MDJ0462862.1 hypothetical protein [Streptomyces sp. H27-C3]
MMPKRTTDPLKRSAHETQSGDQPSEVKPGLAIRGFPARELGAVTRHADFDIEVNTFLDICSVTHAPPIPTCENALDLPVAIPRVQGYTNTIAIRIRVTGRERIAIPIEPPRTMPAHRIVGHGMADFSRSEGRATRKNHPQHRRHQDCPQTRFYLFSHFPYP